MKKIKALWQVFLKNDDGWTFMETLIVIAIILILTTSVGFIAVGSLEKSRGAAARAQIESFATALEAYYIDCGNYPAQEQGLKVLRKRPEESPACDRWGGPYLYKDPPKDPWGYEYEYTSPASDGSPYGIRSFGADGMEGGEGKNEDIKSWE